MRYTEIKVYPKNWEKNIKANLNKEWYLYYEFDKKQIRFKSGVNCCKTLEEKQNFTRYLIDNEYRNLKNGYNPITKEFINPYDSVSEHTPFILALKIASKKIKVSKSTLVGVENAIKIIEQIALKTGHANIEISKIRKRDVRIMMDIVLEQKYSNDKYNKIKSYLGILYNYFVDMEIFEHNYISTISVNFLIHQRKEKFTEKMILKKSTH